MGCSDLVCRCKHTLGCMPRQPAQHKVQGNIACLEKSGGGIREHGRLHLAVCGRLALPGHLDRSRKGRVGAADPKIKTSCGSPSQALEHVLMCSSMGGIAGRGVFEKVQGS